MTERRKKMRNITKMESHGKMIERVHGEMIAKKCRTCVSFQDGKCVVTGRMRDGSWACNIDEYEHAEEQHYTIIKQMWDGLEAEFGQKKQRTERRKKMKKEFKVSDEWETEDWIDTDRRRLAHLAQGHNVHIIQASAGTLNEETAIGTPVWVLPYPLRGHCYKILAKVVEIDFKRGRKGRTRISLILSPIKEASSMSSYWELLGNRSPDFWAGVKEGVTAHAIWRNGTQLVGCMEQPLKEVLAEIDVMISREKPESSKVYNKFIDVWLAVLDRYVKHSDKKGGSFQDVELNFLRTKLSEEFREVCTAISDQSEYDEVVDLILVALMLGSRLRDGLTKEVRQCQERD
jgi:hypothetical protein